MNPLQHLLEYKAWANGLLFDALRSGPAEVVEAKQKIVFGSILRTLNHSYAMDVVWRAHLEGTGHDYVTRNPSESPPLETLHGLQRDLDRWFIHYAADLSEAGRAEVVEFEFIGGGRGRMTRQDILFHVVNHATYHRGHIADMMYNAGTPPPTTDLPVYLRVKS